MTLATHIHVDVYCPVHAATCGFRGFPQPMQNVEGTVVGVCEQCGYHIEIASRFAVTYRRMDDPSITMSHDEFMRPVQS